MTEEHPIGRSEYEVKAATWYVRRNFITGSNTSRDFSSSAASTNASPRDPEGTERRGSKGGRKANRKTGRQASAPATITWRKSRSINDVVPAWQR